MPYLSVNGTRFHYHIDDYSDPWQPTRVVLLHHSAAGNLNRWRAWVPALARHFRVLRYDMRGHGETPPPAGGKFDLGVLASDVAAIMDALEIEKVHLVGASAGGIVSLRFAHEYAHRLHSLTLVASTPSLTQTGIGVDTGLWFRTLQESGTKAWLLSDAQRRFGHQADPRLIDWYATEGEKTTADVVMALQDCLLGEDLIPLLPRIAVPTLILASTQDVITPLELQNLMASQIPEATLQTFDDVGHNMKVEIPELLASHVLRFIEQLEGG